MRQPHSSTEPRPGSQKILPSGADQLRDRTACNGGRGPPSGADTEVTPQAAPPMRNPRQVVQPGLMPGHVNQVSGAGGLGKGSPPTGTEGCTRAPNTMHGPTNRPSGWAGGNGFRDRPEQGREEMYPRRRPVIKDNSRNHRPLGRLPPSLEDFGGPPPLGLPTPHDGRTSCMVDSKGGLLNSRYGAVQGARGSDPFLARAALVSSGRVLQRRHPSRDVRRLVSPPVSGAEPLIQRRLLRKMAADPGNRDTVHQQGP